jgi:hypothetical protein
MRGPHAKSSAGKALAASRAAETARLRCAEDRRCCMSAAPAVPLTIETAWAVAETGLPVSRIRPIDGYAFYRRHTIALLRRYLQVSMELGRTPCVLGNVVFRGRVSSYRMSTFEDLLIFVFDIEKCLKQLNRASQSVIAHMVLEDYTALETAAITGESLRSVTRLYGETLDRLTRQFLQFGLLKPDVENLSRGEAEN